MICAEPDCGLPAELTGDEMTAAGAGYGPPGTECLVWMAKVQCVAGHWYWIETGSVEIEP